MAWLGRLHDRLARSPIWVRIPGEILLIAFVILPAMVWSFMSAVVRAVWRKARGR